MLHNLIGLENADVALYRIFRLKHFRKLLEKRSLVLVNPSKWEDPCENILTYCAITFKRNGRYEQAFFDQTRKPLYAQCWSLVPESDAMWRIYSTVKRNIETLRNNSVGKEGIKVRSTARKLLSVLWNGCPSEPKDACFLGAVQYHTQKQLEQQIANEIGRYGLQAFAGGRGHALSLLIKREPFEHEREVRLIYVEHHKKCSLDTKLPISIDPNTLFEEIVLDPRLHPDDAVERETELRSLGFSGQVVKSELYQTRLFEVVLPSLPKPHLPI